MRTTSREIAPGTQERRDNYDIHLSLRITYVCGPCPHELRLAKVVLRLWEVGFTED